MNKFRTCKVLVVDDNPEEGTPIIRVLGKLGIGAVYHDGNPSAVYDTKLRGVRVLFVDMVLDEFGADPTDPKKCAEFTVNSLKGLIEDSTDPLLAICWTYHKDIVEEFKIAAKNAFPNTMFKCVLAEKASLVDAPDKLLSLVETELALNSPADLLFHWEELVHDAAIQTTGAITALVRKFSDSQEWSENAFAICAALALAERGARVVQESPEQSTKAFFDALNPLLVDRLDHAHVSVVGNLKVAAGILFKKIGQEIEQQDKGYTSKQKLVKYIAVTEELKSLGDLAKEILPKINSPQGDPDSLLSSELRAALNAMLHVSFAAKVEEVTPGNVYLVPFNSANRKTIGTCIEWQIAKDDTFFGLDGNLPANYFPLLMETSPICDFAQDKSKLPRFIGGFLVPENGLSNLRKNAFLRSLGPLLIDNNGEQKLAGVYHLVLNAHFLVSIPKKTAIKMIPVMRIREPALNDFKVWASDFGSRLALLHIGP